MGREDWQPDENESRRLVTKGVADRKRWADAASYSDQWDSRSELASTFIDQPMRVLDLGAGKMALERFLPYGSVYIPADLEPLSPTGIRIDLNDDPLPNEQFDAITLLGVFEYLFRGRKVLVEAAERTRFLIISYCCLAGAREHYRDDRRALGWVTDYTEEEFKGLVVNAGFFHLGTKPYNSHPGCEQNIFLFSTSASDLLSAENLAEILEWHRNTLGHTAKILSWFQSVSSIAESEESLALRTHAARLAATLGDTDALLRLCDQLERTASLPLELHDPFAKALALRGRGAEAAAILSRISMESGFYRRVHPTIAKLLLQSDSPVHQVPPLPANELPFDIRPDFVDLERRAKVLLSNPLEDLSRPKKQLILDYADLSGQDDLALKAYRSMGVSEREEFNLSTIHTALESGYGSLTCPEDEDEPVFGLLSYRTENIGDDIQSLAALNYLPSDRGVVLIPRDDLGRYEGCHAKVIMNGWFGHMHGHKKDCSWPPSPMIHPVFVSFHVTPSAAGYVLTSEGIEYLQKHQPIGCRDLFTRDLLRNHGIQAWLSGCLTATLPTSISGAEGGRVVHVDVFDSYIRSIAAKALTELGYSDQHHRTHDLRIGRTKPIARLYLAAKLLDEYRSSSLVITSRVHCALPCLAMGTPVILLGNDLDDERLDGLGLDQCRASFHSFAESPEKTIRAALDMGCQRPAVASDLQSRIATNQPPNVREFGDEGVFECLVQPQGFMIVPSNRS